MRAARIARLFFLRPIKFSIYGVVVAVPIVHAKAPNTELKPPRRLRQIKHHLKIDSAMVTILRLLLFARIVSLTNYSKNGPVGAP